MERNHKEEIKQAIGMIEVRLKNIENTLATVEMSEDVRKALHEEKEEHEVYLKSLKKKLENKTPEDYNYFHQSVNK
jgi:predicted ribosome quality control (RQC) complex YloA/Tae2 family protein